MGMGEIYSAANSAGAIGARADVSSFDKSAQRGEHGAVGSDTPLQRRFVPRSAMTLALLDLVFMSGFIASFIFAISGRLGFVTPQGTAIAVVCIAAAAMALAYASGCYLHDALIDFSAATTRLAVGLGVGVLFIVPLLHIGLGLFLHDLAFRSISRSVTIVMIGVGAGLCGGILSRILFMAMARRQWFRRTILVIGTGKRARHLRDILERADRRMTEVHFLTEAYLGGTPPADVSGKPIAPLAGAPSARELAQRLHIDQVVVAVDDPGALQFDQLLPWKANGIPVVDFNTFLERETGRVDINWTEPDWLLYSEGFRFGHVDRMLKRAMDLVVSTGLLLITFPALLIVACAIVLDDFGPIFYRQERVSQRGRPFRIIKFRTMRVNAEQNGAQWASEDDPRITRVGRILRRTRIDEIPQLINVLKGEMSVVGPRPERPVFVDDLSQRIRLYNLRHSVKAGVTGWAQINYHYGASVEDAVRKLEYDLYYLKHFSVLRDITIMIQTFRILLFAKGGR